MGKNGKGKKGKGRGRRMGKGKVSESQKRKKGKKERNEKSMISYYIHRTTIASYNNMAMLILIQ